MKGCFVDKRKTINFTADAKKKLEEYVLAYADCIIKEANLIEEANREQGVSQEITAGIVVQASRKNRDNYKRKPIWKKILCDVVIIVGNIIMGYLMGHMDEIAQHFYYLIIVVVAPICTTLAVVFSYLPRED